MPPHAAALPGLTLLLLVLPLAARLRSWREGVAASALLVLLVVGVSSEALSAFGLLQRGPIGVVWTLLAAGAALPAWRARGRLPAWPEIRGLPRCLFLLVPVAALTLLVALLAPPNTLDGMTYHMSRIVHWIDQGSLAWYPTAIQRQNSMPPLAEELILHLQVLSQSDRLANLPAWSYFLLSVMMVSLIAADLGLDRRGQAWAAVLAALTPMALAQATSCKNDAILTFLFLAFCHHLIRLHDLISMARAVPAALALGLGLYCKGTFLLLGAGAGLAAVLLALPAPRTAGLRARHLGLLAGLAVAGFALASPHWIRQLRDPTGSAAVEADRQRNEDVSLRGIAAIAVRSLAVHLTLPLPGWDPRLRETVGVLLGEALNDPRTTFLGFPFIPGYNRSEEQAGNPLHLLLALAAAGALALRYRRLAPPGRLVLLALFLASGLFVTFMKWQPWVSRLHTPLFFLAAPLCALVLVPTSGMERGRRRTLAGAVLALALMYALPVLLALPSRPLWAAPGRSVLVAERKAQFFAYLPAFHAEFQAVDELLRRGHPASIPIGLLCGENDLEYPLLHFAGAAAGSARAAYRFHHTSPGKPETIVLGLGNVGRSMLDNPGVRVVFRGDYLTVYTGK